MQTQSTVENISEEKNTSVTPPFNLAKITEFSHALIYGFDPEESVRQLSNSDNHIHVVGQFEDVFAAYWYAQAEVLPELNRTGIANITPDQLLKWLDQCHLRIAKSLAADQEEAAGQYCRVQAFRFHVEEVPGTLLQLVPELDHTNIKNYSQQAYAFILQQRGAGTLKHDDLYRFLQLLMKLRDGDDRTAQISEDDIAKILPEKQKNIAILALFKLAILSHRGQLTEAERSIVDKVAVICSPPQEFPQKMQDFAKNLLQKWQNAQTQVNDIDTLADLVVFAFKGVAGIHPYFNGNGRTATWLVNLILRSLKQPSLLIRDPGAKRDQSSAYTQAITQIDTKPDLFKGYIKERLQAAKKPYQDEELAKLITARVTLRQVLIAFKQEFPKYDIDEKFERMLKEAGEIILTLKEVKRAADCNVLLSIQNDCIQKLSSQLTILRTEKQNKITPVLSAVQRQYTLEEKSSIQNKLEEITGVSGWQAGVSKGSLVVRLTEADSATSAAVISALAKHKGVITVSSGKVGHSSVLQVNVIKHSDLLAITSVTQSLKKLEFDKPQDTFPR